MAAFMNSASRSRAGRWLGCLRAISPVEEQDDGRIFNVLVTIDTDFIVDLRDNPDQAPIRSAPAATGGGGGATDLQRR